MSTENLAELWMDRHLAWLEFNRRVLAEALDERTPLLERLKFLAIFTSNLDEFFMKRMAVHHAYTHHQTDTVSARILCDARAVIVPMIEEQRTCFDSLTPALEHHGIRILGWADLTQPQRLDASRF